MEQMEKKINDIFVQVQLINQKIDCLGDHEKRIRRLEGFSSKVIGALGIISALFGGAIGLIIATMKG